MCLIIASQTGKLPTEEVLQQGWNDNSDGWGLMQSDGSNVIVNKGLRYKELEQLIEKLNGNPFVIHYRWATHGNKNVDNCHPFRITKQLYMAHNGVINIECPNKLMSDTWHFSKKLIEMGLDHLAIKDEEIAAHIKKWIGSGNKLAFLDYTGNITIVNDKAGHWEDGIWYSNTHSLYGGAASYYCGDGSYYRGSAKGWNEYFQKRYSHHYRNSMSNKLDSTSTSETEQAEAKGLLNASTPSASVIEDEDYRMYSEAADLWDHCEYCGTLDWLEEVKECDSMVLCTPCKRVLVPVYTADRCGYIYDSNGVPYSWDDIDEKIERVRENYEKGRGTKPLI